MKRSELITIAGFLLASLSCHAAEPALHPSLKPEEKKEDVSSVFRDMGVVQRRAMAKGGRFLFSSYGTFDFSDGPYTNYSLNLNPGYAFSDFFEVYLNWAPKFFVSPRSIVGQISQYRLSNGDYATIDAAKPQSQIGLEILWAPAYGKDSFGIHSIIRSDTFFKFGVSQVTYDTDTGLRFVAGVGKTFFLGRWTGLRFCVDFGYLENTIQDQKAYRGMALLEAGLNFYL